MFSLDELKFLDQLLKAPGLAVPREHWRAAADVTDKIAADIKEREKLLSVETAS